MRQQNAARVKREREDSDSEEFASKVNRQASTASTTTNEEGAVTTADAAEETTPDDENLEEILGIAADPGPARHITPAESELLTWAESTTPPGSPPPDPAPAPPPDMVPPPKPMPPPRATNTYQSFLQPFQDRQRLWDPQTKPVARLPHGSATPEAKAEYERKQREGYRPAEQLGQGNAKGTHDALRQSHLLTCVCNKCGGLVDFLAARRNAWSTERRLELQPGDGCASPCCSISFRPGHYADSQRKMARELDSDKRYLIAWPEDETEMKLYMFSREHARVAARDGYLAADTVDAARSYKRRQ